MLKTTFNSANEFGRAGANQRGYRDIVQHPRAVGNLKPGDYARGTFVSADEVNRAEVLELGYRDIVQHPREIRHLQAGDLLVIDFDYILFDDKEAAVALAVGAIQRGVRVRLNTYYPDDPRLDLVDEALRKAA